MLVIVVTPYSQKVIPELRPAWNPPWRDGRSEAIGAAFHREIAKMATVAKASSHA